MEQARKVVGEIGSTNFPTLLVRAAARAQRGLLTIVAGDVERKIYLREGLVLFAGSNAPAEFLAERAIQKGILSRDQVKEALGASTTGRRIGSTLVQLGFLTEEKLVELLLEQVRAIVAACFAIEAGHYSLSVGALPTNETITIDEPASAIVAREVRRIRAIDRLRRAGGESTTAYFPVRGWRERMEERDLGRDDSLNQVAELIGHTPGITIRNIVVSLPRPETDLLQSLWILKSLEIVGTPPPRRETATSRPVARKTDSASAAKKFAEALEAERAAAAPAARAEMPPSPIEAEADEGEAVVELGIEIPMATSEPAPPSVVAPVDDSEPDLSMESMEEDEGIDFSGFDPDSELDFLGTFPDPSAEESTPDATTSEPVAEIPASGVDDVAPPTGVVEAEPVPAVTTDAAAALERALAAAEEEVDIVLTLGMERADSSGSFAATPFSELLCDLSRQRSSGTLICKRNDEEKTVSLDRGRPVFATTSIPAERITERLVSEGILTPSDLVRLTEFWPAARRVGGILLALRMVEPEVLRKAIRRQVTEIIASLYAWSDGGYYFQERPSPSSEEIISDLSLPDLALRGSQKIGDPARLVELMGGRDRRLRVTEDPATLFQGFSLPADQREYFGRIGRGGAIRDLLELGPVSSRAATYLLFTLVASGFLEKTGRERLSVTGIPDPERYLATSATHDDHDDGAAAASAQLAARWKEISAFGDYAVLGIEPGAADNEVLLAFESLAPRYHPDRFRAYADAALLRLAGRVFDRHVLAFYRILNPAQKMETPEDAEVRRAMLSDPVPPPAAPSVPMAAFTSVKTVIRSQKAPVRMRSALILDDDPESSRLISEVLTSLGFAPEVAPGRVALRRILQTPGRILSICLVDVDLLMGLDALNLEFLASSCRDSATPCIGIFSTQTETRDQFFFTKFGIQNLIDKGSTPESIRQQIEAFLEQTQ